MKDVDFYEMKEGVEFCLYDRGEVVSLGNGWLREALQQAILYQIEIWESFGGVRNAPNVLSSIYQRDGENLKNIDTRTVRQVMQEDFPAEFHFYVEHAEQEVEDALNYANENAKHIKVLEPSWQFDCVYVSDDENSQSIRYDRMVKVVNVGLQDDKGTTLASVGIRLEKDRDGEVNDIYLCDHKFFVEGETHFPSFRTELYAKLEQAGNQFLAEHRSELISEYLAEEAQYRKLLPPAQIPGITALYEFTGLDGNKHELPLIDVSRTGQDPQGVLKAVLLKDVFLDTTRLYQYEKDPDPNKFERLAQHFNREIAVTDGQEVMIARSAMPDITGIEKNHLQVIGKLLDSVQIVEKTPVLKQTNLTRMLPFDCDYQEALESGNYLPQTRSPGRQSHSR